MKITVQKAFLCLFLFCPGIITGCMENNRSSEKCGQESTASTDQKGNYAMVNGLKMYYEVHGQGKPLILLHGGGSSISSTYGVILPDLAKKQKVIAIDLQAHGHTADRSTPLSFEQDAADVIALLKQLNISQADFFGFSNGGNTALHIALTHPKLVKKLILGSVFYHPSGIHPGIFESFRNVTSADMPPQLKEAYLREAPDTSKLSSLTPKLMSRLLTFQGFDERAIRSINVPVLIFSGNNDVATMEHTLKLSRLLPKAQLVVLPGGHGTYIGEITAAKADSDLPSISVKLIDEFLQ
jgi:pimeloyl-ACP methyl ester carboxylesterase